MNKALRAPAISVALLLLAADSRAQTEFCPGNLVANGSFTIERVNGSMPEASVLSWGMLTGTPQLISEGCTYPGAALMWGNGVVGESIKQALAVNGIQAGSTYSVTICYRWHDSSPGLPPYVRLRLAVSDAEPVGYPPTSGYDIIGVTPNISTTSWTSYTFPDWTAADNASWLTINPENDSMVDDGAEVSWGAIDEVCIVPVPNEFANFGTRYYQIVETGIESPWSLGIRQAGGSGWSHENLDLPSPVSVTASGLAVEFISALRSVYPSVDARLISSGYFSVSLLDGNGFELGVGPGGGSPVTCWAGLGAPCDYGPLIREVEGPVSGVPGQGSRTLVNYPNPFNPSTIIAFDLPVAANADLRIWDASGRLVRTLIDNMDTAAGHHQSEWDGRDSAGADVAAGVYLCSLRTGAFIEARRMVLLK